MIVDISDRTHLCNEITKDYEALANKCNLIRKKLKKTLGKSKLKNDFFNHKNGVGYKIPESKTFWTIFYKVYKNTSVENTRFICINKHFENRKTFYIVLDSQQINDVLLQIFNPHFIDRFIERLGLTFTSNELEITRFLFEEEFRNIEKWENSLNETKYYQITKWGISLGEYDETQKIFHNKTFLSKKELFEDQNIDLKQHFLNAIKKYDIKKYKSFIEYWKEYLDPIEISSMELLNLDLNQKETPGLDFLMNEINKNWK